MELELNDQGCADNKKQTRKNQEKAVTEDMMYCENCAYSLVENGKIFCADRGFIMRALFGLEQMPSGARCNRFTPSKTR